MPPENAKSYHFRDFEVDLSIAILKGPEGDLTLRPKTFDTLLYLLENPGRLVTKSELMDAIWPNTSVIDDALVQSIGEIRRALKDDPRNSVYIQTVPKRGYIFLPDVEVRSSGEKETGLEDSNVGVQAGRNWFAAGLLLVVCLSAVIFLGWPGSEIGEDAEPTVVLVFPFEVQSDDDRFTWLGRGLADMIGTGLWHSPHLRILNYQTLPPISPRDWDQNPGLPLQVARKVGADQLIVGSVVKIANSLQINAHLVGVNSSREDVSVSVRSRDMDEVFEAADEVCLLILRKLLSSQNNYVPGIADVTTRSLDAYRHYITGLERFLEGGHQGALRAIQELQQAIRIDPMFAMAHFRLAEITHWARRWGYIDSDPSHAVKNAYRYSQDLPEKERMLISGMKYLLVDEQPEKALTAWRSLQETYPTFAIETGLGVVIADVLMQKGDVQALIHHGQQVLDSPALRPDDRAWLNSHLAAAHRRLGDLKKAVAYGEATLHYWPVKGSTTYLFHFVNLARSKLEIGSHSDAVAAFREAIESPAADATIITTAAWGLYMAGQKEEAESAVEEALNRDSNYGNAFHLRGWLRLIRGEYDLAAADFYQAFRLTPPQFGSVYDELVQGDLAALYFAGVARQMNNQQGEAIEIFQKLTEKCRQARRVGEEEEWSAADVQTLVLEALAAWRMGRKSESRALAQKVSRHEIQTAVRFRQLARIFAVQGDIDTSVQLLTSSIEAGNRELQHIKDHPDFISLRNQHAYVQLFKDY